MTNHNKSILSRHINSSKSRPVSDTCGQCAITSPERLYVRPEKLCWITGERIIPTQVTYTGPEELLVWPPLQRPALTGAAACVVGVRCCPSLSTSGRWAAASASPYQEQEREPVHKRYRSNPSSETHALYISARNDTKYVLQRVFTLSICPNHFKVFLLIHSTTLQFTPFA